MAALTLIAIIILSISPHSVLSIFRNSSNRLSSRSAPSYKISRHPRLFFTKRDLSIIKEKIQKDNITRELYAKLITRCNRYINSELPAPRSSGWARYLRGAKDASVQREQCVLAHLLTGRKDFLERARAVIRTVLKWGRWIDPAYEGPGVQADLMTGDICRRLAIAYDWLYNDLKPEELNLKGKTLPKEKLLRRRLIRA